MIEFNGEIFDGLYDRGDNLALSEMSFFDCKFSNCGLSLTQNFEKISRVSEVKLERCCFSGCHCGPVVISNVSASNISTTDLLIFWSPFLEGVTLSGEIGKIKINSTAHPSTFGNEKQIPFDEFRAKFYAKVDWALDISNARFKEFDVRGVPARLIKRDPESQILVTRERAQSVATAGWEKSLDPANKLWPFVIDRFLAGTAEDAVLVAPLGAVKSKRDPLLKGLKELRKIGLAEPD